MKVRNNSLALVLATFAVTAAPALAQSPREGGSPSGGGDSRAGGGGAGNSGNASSGGGGGGGGVATGGGGGSTSSSSGGGSSFSSPSGFGATSPNISFGERGGRRESAPSRRAEFAAWGSSSSAAASDGQARPRTAAGAGESGGGSGERAVPRTTAAGEGRDRSSADNSGARTRMTPPAREANTTGTNPNNTAGAREVPNWSRPRGDNPVTGTAVQRTGPPPDRENYYDRGRYYNNYYDPYYYYGSPRYYGYYYPYYAFGLGYGLYSGWGLNPYYGDSWDPYYSGYGGSGGYSSGVYNTVAQGNLKLKVKPRNAKVYVDGFYVGLIDEFDGAFQKLALNSGRHKVEIRAEGFETAEFDVLITPDQTVTFQGDLKRIQ